MKNLYVKIAMFYCICDVSVGVFAGTRYNEDYDEPRPRFEDQIDWSNVNKAIQGYKYPPLMYTVDTENSKLVERLLQAGANPNYCTPHGCTPLREAICRGEVENVALLLRYGADAQGQCRIGNRWGVLSEHKPEVHEIVSYVDYANSKAPALLREDNNPVVQEWCTQMQAIITLLKNKN